MREQGVCFRMYTEKEAARLRLVGWVKNTRGGTVLGQMQGPPDAVEQMTDVGDRMERIQNVRPRPSPRRLAIWHPGDVAMETNTEKLWGRFAARPPAP
ncbi:acylphosphatase 2, muscle type isoform X3 [Stigmatopora nigra]